MYRSALGEKNGSQFLIGRLTPATIFFISSVVYLAPAFFGLGAISVGSARVFYELETATTIFALGALCFSFVLMISSWSSNAAIRPITRSSRESLFLTLAILVCGLYTVLTPEMYSPSKRVVLERLDPLHLIFFNGAILGVVSVILTGVRRNLALLTLSLIALTFSIFIGNRSYTVIAAVSVAYILLRNRPITIVSLKWWVGAFLFGASLILYKSMYIALKFGDLDRAIRILTSTPLDQLFISGYEASGTILILDRIIQSEYTPVCSNMQYLPVSIIPFSNNFIDYSQCGFNYQFQPELFAFAEYGVGSNIWAELYVWTGFGAIAVVPILVYLFCKCFEWFMSRISSPIIMSGLICSISQFAFYIQRNELMQAATLSKRILYVAIAIWALAWAFDKVIGLNRYIPLRRRGAT